MVNSVNYNAVPSRNAAFGGNKDSSPRIKAAVASYCLPGAGQIMNGDKERGMLHLGIWAASVVGFTGMFFKNIDAVMMKNGKERGLIEVAKSFFNKEARNENVKKFTKGLPKNKKTLAVAIIAGFYANSIISAIEALKLKKGN